jgi:hypothetical protein
LTPCWDIHIWTSGQQDQSWWIGKELSITVWIGWNHSKELDVSMFIEAPEKAIESIVSSRKNVVVVGGSGLYLKSFYQVWRE